MAEQSLSGITAYLGTVRGREPKRGTKPVETRIFEVGELRLIGRELAFGDSWCVPNDAVSVEVEPGNYFIEVEVFNYKTNARVSRVRVLMKGHEGTRGNCCGGFGVDVASAAVFDADAMTRAMEASSDAEWEAWMNNFYEVETRIGFYECPDSSTRMFYTSTGFGDGYYEVFELVNGSDVVGAEVIFLQPNAGYMEYDDGEDEA